MNEDLSRATHIDVVIEQTSRPSSGILFALGLMTQK